MHLYQRLFLLAALSVSSPNWNVEGSGNENEHYQSPQQWDVISPHANPCATDAVGFFGRSAKFEQTFTYRYQLELIKGEYPELLENVPVENSTASTLDYQPGINGVLNEIETTISNALLQSDIFDSVCRGGLTRGPYRRGDDRQLRTKHGRQTRAVGTSSVPDDQILESLTCDIGLENPDNPCYVVDGAFTVYLDIFEELTDPIANLIERYMNEEKSLDNVHPFIEKVRYIELRSTSVSGNVNEPYDVGTQGSGNTNLASSVYVAIAAGTFLLCGTAIFYRRRRNGGDTESDYDQQTNDYDASTAQE